MPRQACVLALVLVLAAPARSTPSAADPVPATALIDLTNAERKKAGLAALRANERLMRAARIHAGQLVDEGRLAHDLPDARYPRLLDRLAGVKYEWRAAGENLAFGQRTATEAVGSWMKSRGHRTNLLNANFTEIGTARAVARNGRAYWVQVFARPAPE